MIPVCKQAVEWRASVTTLLYYKYGYQQLTVVHQSKAIITTFCIFEFCISRRLLLYSDMPGYFLESFMVYIN